MTAQLTGLLKRFAMLIPVLIGISIIAFALGVMAPGDPVEQLLNPDGEQVYTQAEYDRTSARLGLDQPVAMQYLIWLKNLIHGDLGRSFLTDKDIRAQLARRIPISLALACFSMVLTMFFGIGSGALMAIFKDRFPDRLLGTVSIFNLSLPGFWIAILLIYLFAEQWKLLPTSGVTGFQGYILPAVTLALPGVGVCARLTRTALLNEIGSHYVLVSDSKGLSRRQTVVRHVFRNALIPIVTWLGTRMAGIVGGASVIETIFAVPGIGSYAITAIKSKDYYVVQAYVLFCGAVYVITTVLIDLIYLVLNPKLRLEGKPK